jgi:hypothetical protein
LGCDGDCFGAREADDADAAAAGWGGDGDDGVWNVTHSVKDDTSRWGYTRRVGLTGISNPRRVLLLTLGERDLYGYGIVQEVNQFTEGSYRGGPVPKA